MLLFVAMGDFNRMFSPPLGIIDTWWLSESSVSDAAAANEDIELVYALVAFVGDCRIIFFVDDFFSFPLRPLDAEDFLLSLALFLILSLLLLIIIFFIDLGFRGLAVLANRLPPSLMLFVFELSVEVPFWLIGDSVSSPDDVVVLFISVGDSKLLLLQLSQ